MARLRCVFGFSAAVMVALMAMSSMTTAQEDFVDPAVVEQRRQEELQRIEAERVAAEQAAAAQQQQPDEAERQRQEQERIRLEQEAAERQRVEAERVAAEQAAAAQQQQPDEAERQRQEQERIRLEQEAAERQRVEAERVAAEQAETARREREQKQRHAVAVQAAEDQKNLQEGDILITGRTGVNGVVNGIFHKIAGKEFSGRPAYSKFKSVDTGPEALDLGIWWNSGKWYIGMLNEMGSDAAYAFIPSQAPTPDSANGLWTIWNGKTWDADERIQAIGSGPRHLHVGDRDAQEPMPEEDYDEEEYMRAYEERLREQEERGLMEEELEGDKEVDPDAPQAIPSSHAVPKRLRYRTSCPEGYAGCKAGNMCRTCPSECETCQNMRYAHKGVCGVNDCLSCAHGYKHVGKHVDGRGSCEASSSQQVVYIAAGFVFLLLVGAVLYVVGYEKHYKSNMGQILRDRSRKTRSDLPT